MKKLYTIFTLVIVVALCASLNDKPTGTKLCAITEPDGTLKIAGPPPYVSNEPPDNDNCSTSGCHDGATSALNIGNAQVTLDLGSANGGFYTPGQTYTVTVSVAKSGLQRAGFQIIALRDNNTSISPGTFTILDANTTQKRDNTNVSWGCCWQNRVWIEHTANGIDANNGSISWQYQWQAPSTSVGNVSFYLAALEGNNDLTDTLDYVYTIKQTVVPSLTGIDKKKPIDLTVINGSSAGMFVVQSPELIQSVEVINMAGEQIIAEPSINASQAELNLTKKPAGIYIIQVKGIKNLFSQKIVVTY